MCIRGKLNSRSLTNNLANEQRHSSILTVTVLVYTYVHRLDNYCAKYYLDVRTLFPYPFVCLLFTKQQE